MAFLMKGKHWSDRHKFRKSLTYPVIVEPKVDEIRVRVRVDSAHDMVSYLSYAEKPLYNLQFASPMFLWIAYRFGISEFDCGFECNGNFDDSRSYVRSSKNFPAHLKNARKRFYLYDLPLSGFQYSYRRALIADILNATILVWEYLETLGGYTANNEQDVEQCYHRMRELGYEGAMIKTLDHLYQVGKRSQDWLKMKPEDTADGKIIGFVEAVATVPNYATGVQVGDKLGRAGSIIVQLEDGSEARPHGIAHELGRDMLGNPQKYLGEWCEFAFMERDTQGGCRHPVFRRLRDSKD